MPNYIRHNPASTPVAGLIIRFYKSLAQHEATQYTNMLEVDQDYTGTDLSTLKVEGGAVVPLTAQDITDIDAQKAADAAAALVAADLDLRQRAKDWVQGELDSQGVLIRALALVIIDEINNLRAQHGLSARTGVQLRNAIQAKIDDKSADSI